MKSFPGARCLGTLLVLLEFGCQYESIELVHCYLATGFLVLVPHVSTLRPWSLMEKIFLSPNYFC